MEHTLKELTTALHNSWTRETSSSPDEWSEDNPARGQCVASALVMQDYLGGDLLRYEVTSKSIHEMHYCNLLDDGTVVDTTSSQYKEPVNMIVEPVDLKGFSSTREKRLADKATNNRYQLLKQFVTNQLINSGLVT
jgi:hypothetical protein